MQMADQRDNELATLRLPLEPMSYHIAIVRYLQAQERGLWKWFSSDHVREKNNEAVRLDLLKATYRIERDSCAALYEAVDKAASALNLDVPITCYQSAGGSGLNAALASIPGEAHVVLTGPILTTLTHVELQCVLSPFLALIQSASTSLPGIGILWTRGSRICASAGIG